ncbi:site-specific DNA-methyltransferase [Thiolapillus sp.]|uniref:site-specific DNA-methyltransferase n=1 Tax=Thiolapillus sp. TaxID=2017437 RepID=UPI003AF436D5
MPADKTLTGAEKIEKWETERLIPYAKNAREHSPAQVSQIAASITEFGFVNPILVGDDGVIVAGHGRLLAAQQLGMETVPVIVLGHLSAIQRQALVIADNKLALNASWDEELLSLEIQALDETEFDIDLLGFSDAELSDMLSSPDVAGSTDEDDVPEPEEDPICELGEVWLLGDHRLMCGDSTVAEDVAVLMDGGSADMAFTDPPYNVAYTGSILDKKNGVNREIMNDDLGSDFYEFLEDAISNLLKSTNGAVYIAMSSSEFDTIRRAFGAAGGHWSTYIMWAKNRFAMGRSDYHPQYEPILYGWTEGRAHYWCGARDQSNLWEFDRPMKNDLHPTMKPVALVERAINNSSKRGGVVLDLFGGSGTTLIACEKTSRTGRMMELDPKYADVIIRRWQEYTGKQATREDDGMPFDDVAMANAA